MNKDNGFLRWVCAATALAVASCSAADPAPRESAPRPSARDAGSDAAAPVDEGKLPDLTVLPAAAYSGFDGARTYRVPFAVYGAKSDLTVVADKPNDVVIAKAKLADTSNDDGVWFLVTTRAAGEIKLIARSRGREAAATLTVAAYPAARWSGGEKRYTSSGAGGEPACIQCHAGSGGIDHSPAALASATDDDIGRIVRTGMLVSGTPITQTRHRWNVTDEELEGLVTYLRALAPRGIE